MDKLSGADVKSFFVVLAAIVVLVGGILNVIKQIRDWRKPTVDSSLEEQHWRRETDRKLDNDNKRISVLEEGNKALCHGLLALLSHEINGNSVDKLMSEKDKITTYLVDGKYPTN
jgi:hypothetical protein